MIAKDYIVVAEGVQKSYGKTKALDNFSLNIERGKVVGILGPNGTGKTTFLKSLAGLVKIDQGNLRIDGYRPSVKTKALVSFLPDSNYLFEGFTVKEAVDIFRGFFSDFNDEKRKALFSKMNITEDMKISDLSKGYVERLNVALVMSRDSKLFILDEPIGGVDPLAREMILDAIIENVGDATLVLTTHLIDEMEKILDYVVYIDDGKVILEGETDQIIEEQGMLLEDVYKSLYS